MFFLVQFFRRIQKCHTFRKKRTSCDQITNLFHPVMKIYRYFFACCVIGLVVSCKTNVDPTLIIAHGGTMDLAGRDRNNMQPIPLDGEWAFYYNRLLSPADFVAHPDLRPDTMALVPGYWNGLVLHGKKINGQAIATYPLIIKSTPGLQLTGLRVMDAASAYRLWINQVLIAGNGTVSSDQKQASPQFFPLLRHFVSIAVYLMIL